MWLAQLSRYSLFWSSLGATKPAAGEAGHAFLSPFLLLFFLFFLRGRICHLDELRARRVLRADVPHFFRRLALVRAGSLPMVGGAAVVAAAPPCLVLYARHVVADLDCVGAAARLRLDHRHSRMVGISSSRVWCRRLDERLQQLEAVRQRARQDVFAFGREGILDVLLDAAVPAAVERRDEGAREVPPARLRLELELLGLADIVVWDRFLIELLFAAN